MAVIQVSITDMTLYHLFDPFGINLTYPGWNTVGHTLTSPVLYDGCTEIAVSGGHQRESLTINQTYFPVTVGFNAPAPMGCVGPLTGDQILNYNDYFTPADGLFDGIYAHLMGPGEVLTEIQAFNLSTEGQCCTNAPLLPPCAAFPLGFIMVRAGYDNTYNMGAPFYLRRSIGMVQSVAAPDFPPSVTDFPANSFFDIYVEVSLPPVPSTESAGLFPPTGAVLTNVQPLIVESLNLPGPLPPETTYIHGSTASQPFAVDLAFKDNAPDGMSWTAGQVLGQIVLAGHGTFNPCQKGPMLDAFLAAVLGSNGVRAAQGTVGRTFNDAKFPSPNSYYGSAPGTNFSGQSIDAVVFTNGATLLTARDFTMDAFLNPQPLPPSGGSLLYSNANSTVTFDISTDGINFIPATGTGTVQILLVNTNPPAGTNGTSFYSQISALDITGTSGVGTFRLRQSTSKLSPGKHIVQTNDTGNFKIGGYFDTAMEYSFNNGLTYRPANRPIRLQQEVVTICTNTPLLTVGLSGHVVTVTWSNTSYRLQGANSISATNNWVNLPYSSPYIFNVPAAYCFFRLVCP
jgi:hypothetical protein